MLTIGCHLSVSKGFLAMGKTASAIGANTFQFFPRNPRGGGAKALVQEDLDGLKEWMYTHDFGPVLCHAAYTMNGAASRPDIREFAGRTMEDDLARVSKIPRCLYNFHPGSHVGQGSEEGIRLIAGMVNRVLDRQPFSGFVLMETMAGKGTEVGRNFEELAALIDAIEQKDKIGVCLDTCHVYDAGYDVARDLNGVLQRFDDCIGLDRLRAVHLNDDKNVMGSHKDRHEKIGEGTLGMEFFERVINHPRLRKLPFFLETPNDLAGYAGEIVRLRALYREDSI